MRLNNMTDPILRFGSPAKDSLYAITKRRVISEMRDHLRDPHAGSELCLIEYEKLALKQCRDHIVTLATLNMQSGVMGLKHFVSEIINHLRMK